MNLRAVIVLAAVMQLPNIGMASAAAAPQIAELTVQRTDADSVLAHQQLLEKAHSGHIDLYFVGDSIVRRWGATDYPELLANWRKNFFGWNAGNFGWGADRIENIQWRVKNGELQGLHPKVIVLLAGTNNIGKSLPDGGVDAAVADVTRRLRVLVGVLQREVPEAVIVLTAILPRNDSMAVMPVIDGVNHNLKQYADGIKLRFVNINPQIADAYGHLIDGAMNADQLHPSLATYQIWADALKPILTEVLGPPAAQDLAPPPTGAPPVT